MKNVRFLSVVVCLLACTQIATAATVIDLTGTNAEGEGNGSGTANGALIRHAALIQDDYRMHHNEVGSYLQIQSPNSESGYNTGGVAQFDTVAQKTRDVVYSEMTAREIGGTDYYEFLVKINESDAAVGEQLSINEIRIYTSPTASISSTTLADLGTLHWNLDGAEDTRIDLDYNLGSTRTNFIDLVYFVPVSLFGETPDTHYVYTYYEMGDDAGDPSAHSSGNGFEEMFLFTTDYYGDVPEPATMSLLALGGLGLLKRRRK